MSKRYRNQLALPSYYSFDIDILPQKEQKEKMKINHISISRESTWNECKKKYHYRYHLEIIPPTEPIYFLYGKIIHKIIEVHTKAKGQKDINEIVKATLAGDILLEEGREAKDGKPAIPPKKAGPLPYDYRVKLPNHLSSYLKLAKVIGFEGEVEWKFEHDLDPPHNRLLTGFIDRLILHPSHCLIVDYKTTKPGPWRKNASNINGDLQLQCYARMAQKYFGYKAEQIRCALYFLDGAEFVPTQFNQAQIDSVEKRMVEVYKTIQNADPEKVKGTVGKHCYRCDYNDACPFFNMV
jgi:CRISPR/Cas system-associated exonuclease Cas4 (RecB family)